MGVDAVPILNPQPAQRTSPRLPVQTEEGQALPNAADKESKVVADPESKAKAAAQADNLEMAKVRRGSHPGATVIPLSTLHAHCCNTASPENQKAKGHKKAVPAEEPVVSQDTAVAAGKSAAGPEAPPAEPEKKKAKAAATKKRGKDENALLFGPPSQRAAKKAALSDIRKSLHAGKRGSRMLQRKDGGASNSSSQQSSGSTKAPAHAKRKVGS